MNEAHCVLCETFRPCHEVAGEHVCHSCCVEGEQLAPGYAWSKNLLSGNRIMIPQEDKGRPHLDPAYETYFSM